MKRRRRLEIGKVVASRGIDKDERLVLGKCAEYMIRLIRRYSFFDEESMQTLNWILKEDMPKIANVVFEDLRGPK